MRNQLRELIKENYRDRMLGFVKDEWFWADALYFDLYPKDNYEWTENLFSNIS